MTLTQHSLYLILGGGAFVTVLLISSAVSSGAADMEKRLARVRQLGTKHKLNVGDRISPNSVRSTRDSSIPLLDRMVKLMPNPDKLRARLSRTGHAFTLGEYLLMNALAIVLFYLTFNLIGWSKIVSTPLSLMLGLLLPHAFTGIMGGRRIKKFLANFPEAIDTMCRGIRSGLPVTESIGAVGREMPDPIGVEFHRISDGVRMGKSLEAAMWGSGSMHQNFAF